MYRGTTPTLTFHLPMETAALASAYITFSQSGEVKLEKQLSDCTRSESSLGVTLTQAETLAFEPTQYGNRLLVQIRGLTTAGEAFAARPYRLEVEEILKEGVIL